MSAAPSDEGANAPVPVGALRATCVGVLRALDVDGEDAARTVDVLVESDMAGVASHGVMRLAAYVARIEHGTLDPRGRPFVVERHGATALVDGANALGPVAATYAMDRALDLAEESGVAFVTARGMNHFGAAAAYVEQAVARGMVGVAAANSTAVMPAPGGDRAAVGNNPIAFGVPARDEPPVVLDVATSVVSAGKVLLEHRAGRPVPAAWATPVPSDEGPTGTTAAFPYLLRPMADHKGFGLALVIDLLGGVLAGARHGRDVPSFFGAPETRYDGGAWFLALDVARIAGADAFGAAVDAYVRDVAAGGRDDDDARPRAPGAGRARRTTRARHEGVHLADATMRELRALAHRFGAPDLT